MSIEQALECLAFQDAASSITDDLEQALGESSGAIWFEWSDHHGRLKVPIAGGPSPPSGPAVDAAKAILQAHGLLDRVDFIHVESSMSELIAGQERAWTVLEPLARVSRISTGIDPSTNSVVIDTADDLNAEQLELVQHAVRAAGVSVRVEASLGPGPDPNLPPVAVQWTLLSAGEDLRSLLVTFARGLHMRGEPVISLRESENEIRIAIALPDIDSFPGSAIAPVAVTGREIVALNSPVAGRTILGPEGSPSWRQLTYQTYTSPHPLVPRVLGLRPDDAEQLLRAQRLIPELGSSPGREIVTQDPPADSPAHPYLTVSIVAGNREQHPTSDRDRFRLDH
jgi:hypothetical protein